jgi:TorA maturation chaperone TorD
LAKQTDSFPETARSAAIAEERSDLYRFLSTVLRAPLSAPMLRKIRSKAFVEALSAAGVTLDPEFVGGAEASLLDTLAVDFTSLFHGPGGHIAPYESVQTGRDGGELNGRAATAVRDAIETSGFYVDPEARQLPDHISVELEFMAELAREESSAWAQSDIAAAGDRVVRQSEFVKNHLQEWVPEFCRKVRERASSQFYSEIAGLLADLVKRERAELDQCLQSRLRQARPYDPAARELSAASTRSVEPGPGMARE